MFKPLIKLFVTICLLLFVHIANAGTVKVVITSRALAFGGKAFGNVGTYEVLKGKAYGEVHPLLPRNAVITDIQFAPRNAAGMVEYSTDIYILKPVDLNKGNHKLFAELPNRGGKLFGSFNKSNGGNDPAAAGQPDDAFLMNMGYTIVWCGWDISATPDKNNMTITVPVAVNPDGTVITGTSYEYISFDNDKTASYQLAYPAVITDKNAAILTERPLLNSPPQLKAPNDWEFVNDHTIRLLPAGTAFKQSYIYEFTYMAKNPKIAGLGLAATRDLISFLRYDVSTVNPLARDIQ